MVSKVVHQTGTISNLLNQNIRLDGRDLLEYRSISFVFPTQNNRFVYYESTNKAEQNGICRVSMGNTIVAAGVRCELHTPSEKKPAQGKFQLHLDISPVISSLGGGVHLNLEFIRLERTLQTCLKDCLDLESLCIISGETVFLIRLELLLISCDGNALDCAMLAALAALSTFKRPDVSLSASAKMKIHTDPSDRDPINLRFHHRPYIVSLGALSTCNTQNTHRYLIDPTRVEEELLMGKLIIGMNLDKEICCFETVGKIRPLSIEELKQAMKLVEPKIKGLHAVLMHALKFFSDNKCTLYPRPCVCSSSELMRIKKGSSLEEAEAMDAIEQDSAKSEPLNPYYVSEIITTAPVDDADAWVNVKIEKDLDD